VTTELDADLPAVWGIESELRDALVNLVFNAIDAMPRGGQLTLRTRRVVDAGASEAPEPGAARVAVDVVDTGIGMDEHARLHCLEPFFTTKGERGTGLGLAMVYGAAQRHGAEIQIESEPGKGSRFSVLFKSGPQHAPEPVRPAVTSPGAPQTILLIDDDPALLRSLRDILEADGHTIQMADGGRAGLDAFAQAVETGRVPDLVITDLGMPHVDGRSVAAAVKMRSPATPVVLLTGWGQRMVEDGERVAHIDVVLSKPPKLAELRAAIERCRSQGPQA
jgi:CheY-like chemotaxis protein